MSRIRQWTRIGVVIVIAAIVLATAVRVYWPAYTSYSALVDPDAVIKDLPFHDLAQRFLDLHVASSESLVGYNLLLGGLLWALIIFSKEQRTIRIFEHPREDWPEFVSFALSNVLLAGNLVAYWVDTDLVQSMVRIGAKHATENDLSMPDIGGQQFLTVYAAEQYGTISLGLAVSLLYVSLHQLKEERL